MTVHIILCTAGHSPSHPFPPSKESEKEIFVFAVKTINTVTNVLGYFCKWLVFCFFFSYFSFNKIINIHSCQISTVSLPVEYLLLAYQVDCPPNTQCHNLLMQVVLLIIKVKWIPYFISTWHNMPCGNSYSQRTLLNFITFMHIISDCIIENPGDWNVIASLSLIYLL